VKYGAYIRQADSSNVSFSLHRGERSAGIRTRFHIQDMNRSDEAWPRRSDSCRASWGDAYPSPNTTRHKTEFYNILRGVGQTKSKGLPL
jgi:hypothetical protein